MSFLNLSGVKTDDKKSFDVLPAGKYYVRCADAELKDTKAGTGRYIKCKFMVEEGEYENRVIFMNVNIENPNPQAQQIGLGQLKAFLVASAYFNPDELGAVADLVGLKAVANVKIRKSEQFGDSNDISSFSKKKEEKDSLPF
jgi:hypothetical protein